MAERVVENPECPNCEADLTLRGIVSVLKNSIFEIECDSCGMPSNWKWEDLREWIQLGSDYDG